MQGVRGALARDEVLGKYRIVLPLGQGGTADVYLAVAEGPSGFHKLVVLKVLRPCFGDDPDFRSMFLAEARLAARLHHPNIVQTNEVLEIDGAPILVMEYLEGQPLSQVIVRGKGAGFTTAMHLRVLIDALAGLHRAHELADFDGTPLAVVHRDVSPQNVFVTVEGQAKVLDFGIAKLERSLVETSVGTVKGKLRYMAPEQVAGEKLDRRADVYAAGVMLWEALAGERMWKGCAEEEIRTRVRAGDVPTPALPAGLPRRLEATCRRALSLRAADRHATALELADELDGALAEMGGASHRDIGATVARLFEDVRIEIKAAIERQLGRISMTALPAISDTPVPAGVPIARPVVRTAEYAPVAASVPVPGRRRAIAAAVAAGILIATVLIAASALRPSAPSVTRTEKVVAIPSHSTPVAPLAPVQPAVVEAPAGVAAAPLPRRESRDAKAAARKLAPAAKPGPAGEVAPPAPDTRNTDCRHPFFSDADGIKRFRPECM
jgi:eukaryotic-like serine/threonine-protein kinase